jgi:hypothetical protein
MLGQFTCHLFTDINHLKGEQMKKDKFNYMKMKIFLKLKRTITGKIFTYTMKESIQVKEKIVKPLKVKRGKAIEERNINHSTWEKN